MKLFISWSGNQSKRIALAFRQWLPTVIQSVKPWMSDVDIGKGSDWSQEMTAQLEGTAFGLFCLTKANLNAPWLLFEAGAIGKRPGTKKVFTHVFDMNDPEVPWPLTQFQYTKADREDTLKMLLEVNKQLHEPLDKEILRIAFERGWPYLEKELEAIRTSKEPEPERQKNQIELMLEEILVYVRQQSRRGEVLHSLPGRSYPPGYVIPNGPTLAELNE